MPANKKHLTPRYCVWVDARNKFRLAHAHVQMARELGLNPRKLGSLANHDQEKWKSPLPQFLEGLYHERFGRNSPELVVTIEELAQRKKQKRATQESAPTEPMADIDGDPF